jgi:hypothetical protein
MQTKQVHLLQNDLPGAGTIFGQNLSTIYQINIQPKKIEKGLKN